MLLTVMHMIMNQINLLKHWATKRASGQTELNSIVFNHNRVGKSTVYMAKTPLFQVPKHMHL